MCSKFRQLFRRGKEEKFGVEFIWGTAVSRVSPGSVYSGKNRFDADLIFICSGADFEVLYPENNLSKTIGFSVRDPSKADDIIISA